MNIVICDRLEEGEQHKQLLDSFAKKHNVNIDVRLMNSGKQLLFNIESKHSKVDLIYIDYNLKDESGFEVAKALREREIAAEIVFYTRDEVHAINGYEVEALNYLIKDKVSNAKLERVFLKAIERTRKRDEEVLSLFCAGENRKVEVKSIQYFEVYRRIVTVHYGDNETFEFYSTLSRLEEMLCSKGFVRIHQSYLVAERYIRQKTKQSVVMKDKSKLPIGRSYQGKVWET